MAPLPAVGMKAISATSALRTLQEGCQCSGWYEDMDRQILTPTSKRPLGDSMMKLQVGSSRKGDKAARGHDGESLTADYEGKLGELEVAVLGDRMWKLPRQGQYLCQHEPDEITRADAQMSKPGMSLLRGCTGQLTRSRQRGLMSGRTLLSGPIQGQKPCAGHIQQEEGDGLTLGA